MIRTTGREWKKFLADNAYWGDLYMEDEAVIVNGRMQGYDFDPDKLADNDRVVVKDGYVLDEAAIRPALSLRSHFNRWRKNQSTLLVECDEALVEQVRQAVLHAGGKVVTGGAG